MQSFASKFCKMSASQHRRDRVSTFFSIPPSGKHRNPLLATSLVCTESLTGSMNSLGSKAASTAVLLPLDFSPPSSDADGLWCKCQTYVYAGDRHKQSSSKSHRDRIKLDPYFSSKSFWSSSVQSWHSPVQNWYLRHEWAISRQGVHTFPV